MPQEGQIFHSWLKYDVRFDSILHKLIILSVIGTAILPSDNLHTYLRVVDQPIQRSLHQMQRWPQKAKNIQTNINILSSIEVYYDNYMIVVAAQVLVLHKDTSLVQFNFNSS